MTKEQMLSIKGAILIGSRGLGVATIDSDYDVAVKLSDLPQELIDVLNSPSDFNIRKYFNKLPLGNGYYIPKLQVEDSLDHFDVIIFEDDNDFGILEKAMKDMLLLPQYMITSKDLRIQLFELALGNYGFVDGSI